MAVQMAPPASDFANVCAPAKTVTGSGDAAAAFKNILQGMRESRQKTLQAAKTAAKEPKTPVNLAFFAGDEDEHAANSGDLLPERSAELEKTPDDGQEVKKTSRFDPDLFLEALKVTAADKSDETGEHVTDTTEYAETDRLATEDGVAGREAAREVSAPDSGENKAQSAELSPSIEMNAPVSLAEINAETTSDAEQLSDGAAGRPAREINAEAAPDMKNFSGDAAEVPVRVRTGTPKESAVPGAPQGAKSRESEKAGAAELPGADENAKHSANAGDTERETSSAEDGGEIGQKDEKTVGEKTEPRVLKTVSRAAADAGTSTAHKTDGENPVSDKSSEAPERAASPSVSAFNPFAEASRTETRPLASDARVYTLTSGDKFGEGLRYMLTLMRQDGSAEARIVVEPPALGRVDISLRSSTNGVEANFKVDNEELRQMVQKQMDSLKESLQAQGIHVSGLTVDIKNNEGERDRGGMGASKKGRRQPRFALEDEDAGDETRILRLDLERGLLHWVA